MHATAAIAITVPTGPTCALSPFQQRLVLSAFPRGAAIADARYTREGQDIRPVWVRVVLPDGALHALILRLDRWPEGVAREARLLPLLAQAGLPVAHVLAGPVTDPDAPHLGAMAVYSVLEGTNLLQHIYRASTEEKPRLATLLLEAIDRLQESTPRVRALLAREGLTDLLPRKGLAYEFRTAIAASTAGGTGSTVGTRRTMSALRRVTSERIIERATAVLGPLVEQVEEPLCFWNGDYNPANFLSDGHRLTGFVDFAHAAWHDPHYGLARFTVYDWVHLDRPQLFARYCARHQVSERDFALRSAVHCLWLLNPTSNGDPVSDAYRARILRQLETDLDLLST